MSLVTSEEQRAVCEAIAAWASAQGFADAAPPAWTNQGTRAATPGRFCSVSSPSSACSARPSPTIRAGSGPPSPMPPR